MARMFIQALLVMVGGAIGSLGRYWVQNLAAGQASFFGAPVGTLTVNVLGCFAIGALGAIGQGAAGLREELRLFLMTGVLGGFTTFSAFGLETIALAFSGSISKAIINVALSNILGIGAACLGYKMLK
jgi:CrcB protein